MREAAYTHAIVSLPWPFLGNNRWIACSIAAQSSRPARNQFVKSKATDDAYGGMHDHHGQLLGRNHSST